MREKREEVASLILKNGITPASAGKTTVGYREDPKLQDHPRECGKNFLGLSPLGVNTGITPASAGKTFQWLLVSVQAQDHPRECGKNCSIK